MEQVLRVWKGRRAENFCTPALSFITILAKAIVNNLLKRSSASVPILVLCWEWKHWACMSSVPLYILQVYEKKKCRATRSLIIIWPFLFLLLPYWKSFIFAFRRPFLMTGTSVRNGVLCGNHKQGSALDELYKCTLISERQCWTSDNSQTPFGVNLMVKRETEVLHMSFAHFMTIAKKF